MPCSLGLAETIPNQQRVQRDQETARAPGRGRVNCAGEGRRQVTGRGLAFGGAQELSAEVSSGSRGAPHSLAGGAGVARLAVA